MIEPIRYKKQSISKKVFESFFKECNGYNQSHTEIETSPVWSRVISNHTGKEVFDAIESKDINRLKSLYEDYYIYGISEGASSGKALTNNTKYRVNKSKRNIGRVEPLSKHFNLDTNEPTEVYRHLYQKFNVPKEINIGQTWGWQYNNNFVHFELADYLYFLDVTIKIMNEYELSKTMFIGDGSGLLSCLLYNNFDVDSSSHIDLAHLLLRQYINNFHCKTDVKHYYAESFDKNLKHDTQIVINQDSLPEMKSESVEKYVDNIDMNNVPFILSYNIENGTSFNPHHSDYRGILKSRGYQGVWRLDSTVRPPYVIELFYKGENDDT